MVYPKHVQEFMAAVEHVLGKVDCEIEETRDGSLWLDFRGRRHLAVEWRPGRGFGLSAEPVQYGEGPSELYSAPERAARRVGQILTPDAAAVCGLAAVRELYGKTQVDVAEILDKGQPAISGIEKGRDSKLETIDTFIRALGGRMEVRAVFPDGSLPIAVVPRRGGKQATAKRARAARA
jgi:hypothetical protein